MRIDTKDPRALWGLYDEGNGYNSRINLYHTVETNEAFYAGDQWRGLNAPDIDKPIVNIIRQPINYMAAMIVSDDVAIDLEPCFPSSEDERYLAAVLTELERVREQCDFETINRDAVRNAAVDGDMCLYHYWDESVKTGQDADGDVRVHLVENTNCIFGNPACGDPQRQPYIIIVMRDYIEDVIDEAIANGMSESEARDTIKPDSGESFADENFDKLVTKILTFYRKDGTIHAVISTANAIIREEWDTGLTLYPVAWFSWQRSRNSYHGVSIVTELVPTQIYVNKMVSNYLRCTSMYAWPKIIYNRAMFPNGWNNRIGANVEVNGNPNDAYAAIFPGTGASQDVANVLDWIINRAKEASGANDAALGQMKSDNTSAIIAMQEANTVPLDLVQRGFYSFQEQSVRIILDMLRAYAGTRYIALSDDEVAQQEQMDALTPITDAYDGGGMEYGAQGVEELGNMAASLPDELSSPVIDSADSIGTDMDIANAPEGTKPVDFSKLGDMAWQLKVSVGAGSYFSEALRNTTLSNLVQMGLMDAIDYYKRIPEKYVPNKQEIIDKLEEQQAMNPQMGAGGYGGEDLTAEDGTPDIGDSMPIKQAKNYIQGMRPMV